MFSYLSREQSVGIKLLQSQHQLVLGGDDVLHKTTGECKPVRATGDLQALWDAAFAETPHVVVTLVEETVEALLLNKPCGQEQKAVCFCSQHM